MAAMFGLYVAAIAVGLVIYTIIGILEGVRRRPEPTRPGRRFVGDLPGPGRFWERTFQNWQSEFLAVGTMAIFTVYLRQRGSPESKPVGAAHDDTAASG